MGSIVSALNDLEKTYEKLKSDIVWFGTGLTKCEFEACKSTAEDYFRKGYTGDEYDL